MQHWLIRHAQPLVAQGVCYGALDLAADSQATAQAAAALAASLPQGTYVYCSVLQRCKLLAQCLLGLRPDLILKMAPDLVEMDFGAWEGQRWDDIAPAELKAWTDDFENYACGGSGESAGQFVRRVHRAVHNYTQHSTPTAWITHAGVIRAIAWIRQQGLTDLPVQPLWPSLGLHAHAWPRHAPAFGQAQRLDWSPRT
jgi:alpha-ribazole phosphatase